MPVEVIMPELGESIVEGTVSRWLKKEGDTVREDEEIVEVMTDKVNTTLPAPTSGVLSQIIAKEGDVVAVKKPLAVISLPGEASNGAATAAAEPAAVSSGPDLLTPPSFMSSESPAEGRRFSPLVRRMAREHELSADELNSIVGTGSGGRVTKYDVEKFLSNRPARTLPAVATATPAAPPTPTAPSSRITPGVDSAPPIAATAPAAPVAAAAPKLEADQVIPLTGLRKVIADQMVRSYNIPQVSTVLPVDVTKLMDFRARNKDNFEKDYGVRLTFTPFFAKAVGTALAEFPNLNARIEEETITLFKSVNLGVAVALGEKGEGGLIVPVIRNLEAKSLVEIARDLDEIAKKARKSQLGTADIQGGTFTLTNPGSYGAVMGTPILNAPQTGILGTYAIVKQPVVIDDMIGIRAMMNLVLTYDHRLVDGMYAGRFLQRIKQILENVEFFK